MTIMKPEVRLAIISIAEGSRKSNKYLDLDDFEDFKTFMQNIFTGDYKISSQEIEDAFDYYVDLINLTDQAFALIEKRWKYVCN